MLLDGESSTALSGTHYEQFRRAARTYRQELVVRFAGEAGLRPAEITNITPGDVVERTIAGNEYPFLSVPAVGDRGTERMVFLRGQLDSVIARYADANDIGEDEPLLDVSTRRIQMLVAEVGDRAAVQTGTELLANVSLSDLREAYARRLIRTEGVNPRIVQDQGGWPSLDSLADHFDSPTPEAVVAALDGDSTPAARVTRVVRAVASVTEALPSAGNREAVEETTVSALADTPVFEAAWVGDATPARRDGPRVVAGIDAPTVAARLQRFDEPTVFQQARETGVVHVRPFESRTGAVAAIPLDVDSTGYGVLGVTSTRPDAFGPVERQILAVLGSQVAYAITAVERKRLLLADTVVELAFQIRDESAFFARASAELAAEFELQGLVPADDGALLHYVTFDGAAIDRVLELAEASDGIGDVRLVRDYSDGAVLEIVVTDHAPAMTLVNEGGTVHRLTASEGVLELTAEFAPDVDLRSVVERLTDRFTEADLTAKREVERGVRTAAEYRETLDDLVTEKQRSVLQAAYHADYFAWPRGATAEELADSMGISSPTLHNHLRKGQQKLLSAVIDHDRRVPLRPDRD